MSGDKQRERWTSAKAWKFDWMEAVNEDRRFTHGQARILTCLALHYVKNAVNTTYVSQSTIAKRVHISRQTVSDTYSLAMELGYLTLEVAR